MQNKIISAIVNRFRPNNAILDLSDVPTGWHPVGSTYNHFRNDEYENGYSSIRAIANRFMVIRPHAIDDNGKPLKQSPNFLNCLARPNQDMSGVDFRDALAVMTMVHDKVYILVHEKDGRLSTKPAREDVPEERIAGLTFLEHVVEVETNGQITYEVYDGGTKEVYYPYQVAVLNDINPNNLSNGYSPTKAAKRWTRIDDYIADYQGGFFENGAVPAGQFVITAPTAQEYKDIVAGLKKKHRGAGKNNNVTYTYAPIDPGTGKPGQASITWVPFNTTNKDLSLKELFEQANKKIDSVYGVSAFIRAIDEAPNFATAQVIERNFVENTVRPFAIKKWGRLQHELNRITGGLGYGLAFELDTPHIAEEEQSVAETDKTRVETLQLLTSAGYTLESAIDALKLPPNWKLLEMGESTETEINNDKTEVDEGGEVQSTPENKINNPENMAPEDMPGFELRLQEPARALMQKQVDHAIETLSPDNATGDPTEEDKETFVDEMMVIIAAILLFGGLSQWEEGKKILRDAGVEQVPDGPYELPESAEKRYRKYLATIADSYSEDTATAIRSVLSKASTDGFSVGQTEAALQNIMNTDEWRVVRLATTEVNRSGSLSGVEAMRKIADESGARLEKSMLATGAKTCEFCLARVGVWYPVDDVMVKKGDIVTGVDGGTFVNNWDDNQGHDIHPNGDCVPQYRVVDSPVENMAKLETEISDLKAKLQEADGRTKEAKELKSKLEETEEYAKQLESILDGQG